MPVSWTLVPFPLPVSTLLLVLGLQLAYWMLISSSNSILQCRGSLYFGPNVRFLEFMFGIHLWNLWNHVAGWVYLKLFNGPIQAFNLSSVVFTCTCRTYLLTDDRQYTFSSSSAGFREVWSHLHCCWLSLVLWIWLACRTVVLSPKAQHMTFIIKLPSLKCTIRTAVSSLYLNCLSLELVHLIQHATQWVMTVKGWCENSLWFLGVMLCVWGDVSLRSHWSSFQSWVMWPLI